MDADQPALIHLDSAQIGDPGNMRTWRENVARAVLGLDFRPLDDKPFRVQMAVVRAGAVTLSRSVTSPAESFRDQELVDPNSNSFTFAWPEGGALVARQRGQEAVLGAGDGILLSSDEFGSLAAPRGGRYVGVIIPRGMVEAHVTSADDLIMQSVRRNVKAMRLVQAYSRLITHHAADALPSTLALMGDHLAALIAMALGDVRSDAAGPNRLPERGARFDLVKNWIADNASDPALSLSAVARACGLSSRSIQMLFEERGQSYSSYLLEVRLERAYRLLTAAGAARDPLRVIDVALAVGFSDVSYFNRRFRSRFGETPTSARGGRGSPGSA
ncbi:helix-turn-helix domain-containing protein [Phreatobacter aquaticus]|uniref:Helix-turn-helix domain-containing protein n=1 Tax=Phreatobacter aquaticus TaxID=2570229 RepID=A0A4D7QL93_9HYPH|nr:AraC family transcriptional regulator [Phreatobacter aquaticus]QCK87885.1 helix-turn-helix domain-containing protein [Phreatobacter aquaticus]